MYVYPGPQLHIVSEDKKFIISYQPGQSCENSFLIVKGIEFEGIQTNGGKWVRIKTPKWDDTQITPGFVRRLIDWSFDKNETRVTTDYLGQLIGE